MSRQGPDVILGGRHAADVLVVCTGNVCRSPYLALRLAAAVPSLRVTSAGVGAAVGSSPTPEIVAALAGHGVSADGARARMLTARIVRGARLVLTATAQHRIDVATAVPEAAPRIFTVKEFARLVARFEGGFDAALVHALQSDDAGAGPGDDLADPYGRGADAYAVMVREADAVVDVLASAFA